MPDVLITGASGFIAGSLARKLQKTGMDVWGISRKSDSIEGFNKIIKGNLGKPLELNFGNEPIDVVVHCALDTSDDSFQINATGTLQWLEELSEKGVSLQIFLSSLSAERESISDYGRSKYFLENEFLRRQQVVFRLGLVIGNGGMFARMLRSYSHYPLIPLLDSGRSIVYILGIDALCNIIQDCILKRGNGMRDRSWNIQQPKYYRLYEIIRAMKDQFGFNSILIPVPSKILLRGLTLVENLKIINLPISSENILGLIQRGEKEVNSDYPLFGYPEESLEDLVKKVVYFDG